MTDSARKWFFCLLSIYEDNELAYFSARESSMGPVWRLDLPNGVQCNVVLEMAAGQPGQEVVAEPNLSAMVAPLSTILLHFLAGL